MQCWWLGWMWWTAEPLGPVTLVCLLFEKKRRRPQQAAVYLPIKMDIHIRLSAFFICSLACFYVMVYVHVFYVDMTISCFIFKYPGGSYYLVWFHHWFLFISLVEWLSSSVYLNPSCLLYILFFKSSSRQVMVFGFLNIKFYCLLLLIWVINVSSLTCFM